MEFGEDIDEHLTREVTEETGLAVAPGAPFFIWQWTMVDIRPDSDDELQVIAVARTCEPLHRMVNDAFREETDFLSEMRWVTLDELRSLEVIPSLRPALETFIASCADPSSKAGSSEGSVP